MDSKIFAGSIHLSYVVTTPTANVIVSSDSAKHQILLSQIFVLTLWFLFAYGSMAWKFFPYNVVASDPLWNHPSNQLDRFARGMVLRLLVFSISFVAADIVFIVKDKPHQIFQRDSDNIIYTATIPLLKVSLFIAEAYSEPCQSPKMELFLKKNSHLKVVNYFCKKLHLNICQSSEHASVWPYFFIVLLKGRPPRLGFYD